MRALCLVGEPDAALALADALIRSLCEAGHTVSAVVLDADERDYDRPGKDSERHRRAGAAMTALVGRDQYALHADTPSGLDILLARLAPVDLVLVLCAVPQAGLPWVAVGSDPSGKAIAEVRPMIAENGQAIGFAPGSIDRLSSLVIPATLQDKSRMK